MKLFFALILVATATLTTPVVAQTYKWVDANGQKHFSNTPPPEQTIETVTIKPAYESSARPEIVESDDDIQTGSVSKPTNTRKDIKKADDLSATCRKAINYTAGDLPDLRISANRNLAGGLITKAQHKEAIAAINMIESKVSNYDCMHSKGKDLQMYQCLAGGAGMIGCSGGFE